ncbi:TlpA disulfide reductase family protein [Lacinutrix sp. Bg11-31]|uniref:TlpA family protein disulfide reductase n=1 Tax=Lacinutrix sp. Bg11-31 TaxID=2057808 RepID=UPI000C30BF7D|nr:TlpA disulfide reductase family protein [Lacinutrix sp. Bg11-31]AUC81588.1 TlpA family protein disulfide reductase [Lacinutrix sp. Bg11-31]
MKKLLLGLSVLATVACKQEPKIDYVVLSGKMDAPAAKKAMINGIDFKQEINIAEDGTFADTLRVAESGFYNISVGRERASLYLKHGDNVTVNKSANGFSFEGPTATVNNYFKTKDKNNATLRGDAAAFYSLNESDFKAKVNALKDVNIETLNKLESADANFVAAELKNLQYDSYALLNDYENAHGHFAKIEDFKASEDFLPSELKTMTYDNEVDYKNSSAYQQLAFGSILNPIFDGIDDISELNPSLLQSVSDIKIPALKNEIVEYLAKMALSPGNTSLNEMYTFLSENTTDDKTKEDIKVNYEKSQALVMGKTSPTFENYENHKGGTTSLSDLKGKYVYVDVWATWCGPCKAEIPSLQKVEKQYHGKNIAFVSTSVDTANAYDKWKAMVKDKELGGIQLLADKAWESKFVQDYGINGIPRFILIDPAGNIVSADAPRPSSPKLIELFDSLSI